MAISSSWRGSGGRSGRGRRRRRFGRARFFGACFLLWRLSTHGEIPNDARGQALLPLRIKVRDLEAHEFPAILGGLAIQYELGDVGQGDGVAPGNAFDGHQLKKIAEETIHGGWIVKVC